MIGKFDETVIQLLINLEKLSVIYHLLLIIIHLYTTYVEVLKKQ